MSDHFTCTVEISPEEVDAGAELTFKVGVACAPPRDLGQSCISIRNQDGVELALAELEQAGDDLYESDDIVLTAPGAAGEHVYRAVVVTADKDGALHEQASAEVHFTVKPHAAELNVWDVPSAVVAGERFKFTVGVRCSAGCDLRGQALAILDDEGVQVGAATLGRDVWPGTEALYFAAVETEAPQNAGDHRWEVKSAAWSLELPHDAGSFAFGVKAVSPPDCAVTVEAFDREQQTPIKGARVVMHPYRALTDERGVATVKVTKGRYDILVSASKYVPVSTTVEVNGDMSTRAELDVEPPLEPADEI